VPQVKLFSIDQAEKALPLVKRIVGDIVRTFEDREKKIDARRELPLNPAPGTAAEDAAFKLESEMESLEAEIVRYHQELVEIGVELKDFKLGLIDFYARYEDRIVYLCWKLHEADTLAWYHELHSGFRGRMPVTPANRNKFQGLKPGEKWVELT